MKKKILILLNVLIVGFEVIGLFLSIKEFSYKLFTYYTQYSNILALISSVMLLCYVSKKEIPKWVKFLRYVTAHLLTITFLIVSFVLVPMLVFKFGTIGFKMLTEGSMFYHHVVCPILFICSFIFLEECNPITNKDYIYALIPTGIYAVVILIFNLLGVVDGPYPFFRVLYQPFYITVAWLLFISYILYFVAKKLYEYSLKFTNKSKIF